MDDEDGDGIVVTVRWLSVTTDDLIAEARMLGTGGKAGLQEIKWRILEKMGITEREATPLATYLKAMHCENGLPYTMPAHPAIGDAVSEGGAARFVWWLA